MPTYVCYAQANTLDTAQKHALAQAITQAHSGSTGAPQSFVQCIFQTLDPTDHFIGGHPVPAAGLWVYGHIRGGRTLEAKNRVITTIRDAAMRVAAVPADSVWVYLNELEHTDMIEFGEVLPADGAETSWIEALPEPLRNRLVALG